MIINKIIDQEWVDTTLKHTNTNEDIQEDNIIVEEYKVDGGGNTGGTGRGKLKDSFSKNVTRE